MLLAFDLQLHLFNVMIVPILLYGSEAWGHENVQIIDQFQLSFFQMMLNLKKCTSNIMIYGELGLLPLSEQIKCRVLNFWCKLLNSKNDKISCVLYKTAYSLDAADIVKFPWIKYVKKH